MRRKLAALLFLGFVTTTAPSASGDVPPPDSCTTVGESCNNAGSGYDQPGTCVTSTCTRATPDGSVQYECSRCVAGSAGTGGGTSTGGAAGAGGESAGTGGGTATGGSTSPGDAGDKSGASSDDGCGCSFAHDPPAIPALFVAFGLAMLAVRRARRG